MSDRPATISPSKLTPLMAKSGLGAGADTFADELIMRMLGVDFSDGYTSYAMQRGTELEPEARLLYEKKNFVEVDKPGRFFHPEYDFVSGEPDGIVGNDGLIEIKCPKKKYHLANLRDAEQVSKYYSQMQGYMWITDRQWCDFVSYDPRFPEGMKLAIERVERDQETIDLIEERSIEFWEEIVTPKMKEFNLL